ASHPRPEVDPHILHLDPAAADTAHAPPHPVAQLVQHLLHEPAVRIPVLADLVTCGVRPPAGRRRVDRPETGQVSGRIRLDSGHIARPFQTTSTINWVTRRSRCAPRRP